MRTQALKFNLISGFHLIAGFKVEIKAGLMKKEGQLTTLAFIRNEAVQLELILKEKKINQPLAQIEPMVMEQNQS